MYHFFQTSDHMYNLRLFTVSMSEKAAVIIKEIIQQQLGQTKMETDNHL